MSQKIEIVGHEIEVTERIMEYVNKKVSKFDRLLNAIEETRIDLEHVKSVRSASDRYIAQITLRGKGFILRSEESGDDIRPALDKAVDKIGRQIEHYKGKHFHGRGDGKSATDVTPELAAPEEETSNLIISRRKTFDLVPMNESEALEHMRLLGHDNFFIFYNINTNSVSVVYHRRDGTYGLIEPRVH
jgi:putative sigma-54 modulation protein